MRVNSSREHPPSPSKPPGIPRHLKKLLQCPALRAIFVGKYPSPHPSPFLLWWSNACSQNITKLLVVIFNKHNCFSSIELHKTNHEMSHSDWKKDKENSFIAFISLLWSTNALHPTPKWQCLTVWNPPLERRRKWRQDGAKQVFLLFANAQGVGTLLTAKCPAPGTHRASNARGLPGGDARGWNRLAHYLLTNLLTYLFLNSLNILLYQSTTGQRTFY